MTDRKRLPRTLYTIRPGQVFPTRWRDHIGPLRVMAGPAEGYVMVRRPRAYPFVLPVPVLLNAAQHPTHGPFELVEAS